MMKSAPDALAPPDSPPLQRFASLEQAVYFNLCQTADQLMRGAQAQLHPQGLSCGQYNALRLLRGFPEPVACGQLAEALRLQGSDVTRLIDRLVRMGLVQRLRTAPDRRIVLVALTGQGEAVLEAMDRPLAATFSGGLAHMSHAELERLNELLIRAREGGRAEPS